ncbi:MAG TPA: hypothetical protein VM936_18180 [Pyrinomonadaceae bacterium]|nr:hypothetical protein [Pyrinomonadaceae bacterium]
MHARDPFKLLTLALVVSTLAAVSLSRASAQTKRPAKAAAPAAKTVIFAVSKYETNVTMEPVVVYSRGVYAKPPTDGDEATVKTFVGDYFKPGRQYRVLSGGGEAGTLTVKQYQEPGCVGLNAEVTVNTPARLGGNVQALATNSQTLGKRAASRRAPTDIERVFALMQAQAAYANNRVGAALVKKMEVVNLTATDLDGDGNFELVGSFRIDGKTKPDGVDSYNLFMITTPVADYTQQSAQAGKPALVWFHHGGEADYAERKFVDQIDIDGDGVAEVIAGGGYYESNDYIIYKRQAGSWRPVYQGGGGGC